MAGVGGMIFVRFFIRFHGNVLVMPSMRRVISHTVFGPVHHRGTGLSILIFSAMLGVIGHVVSLMLIHRDLSYLSILLLPLAQKPDARLILRVLCLALWIDVAILWFLPLHSEHFGVSLSKPFCL
jgi:hypothetical protein